MDLLNTLKDDVESLKSSVEFNNALIEVLKRDNASLRTDVINLQRDTAELQEQNLRMSNEVLDLQSRSMRDNIIFHGLPEGKDGSNSGKETHQMLEQSVKAFMMDKLKMNKQEADSIRFSRVHRLGQSKPGSRSRPIVAKVTESSMKYSIMAKGKALKKSDFSITDQYPPEIMKRRHLLYPVMTEARDAHRNTRLFIDKLYIDGQLYRNSRITYWLAGGDERNKREELATTAEQEANVTTASACFPVPH